MKNLLLTTIFIFNFAMMPASAALEGQASLSLAHKGGFVTPDRAQIQAQRKLQADLLKQQQAHENNEKLLGQLEAWSKDKNYSVAFTTPEARLVRDQLKAIKETPSNSSKAKAGEIVVNASIARIASTQSNSKSKQRRNKISSPNEQYNLFKNFPEDHTKQLLQEGAKFLPSPEARKKYAQVDIEHVLQPTYKFDENNELLGSSGGHVLEEHLKMDAKLFPSRSLFGDENNIFIGQDNETIGLPLADVDAKSVKKGMTAIDVENVLRNSKTIAKNPFNPSMRISQILNAEGKTSYFASYQHPHNALLYPSLFPVLMIDEAVTNAKGHIYAGKFQQCDKDANILPQLEEEIYLTPALFQHFIESGKAYNQQDPTLQVVDITQPLEHHLKEYTRNRTKNFILPGVYALRRR